MKYTIALNIVVVLFATAAKASPIPVAEPKLVPRDPPTPKTGPGSHGKKQEDNRNPPPDQNGPIFPSRPKVGAPDEKPELDSEEPVAPQRFSWHMIHTDGTEEVKVLSTSSRSRPPSQEFPRPDISAHINMNPRIRKNRKEGNNNGDDADSRHETITQNNTNNNRGNRKAGQWQDNGEIAKTHHETITQNNTNNRKNQKAGDGNGENDEFGFNGQDASEKQRKKPTRPRIHAVTIERVALNADTARGNRKPKDSDGGPIISKPGRGQLREEPVEEKPAAERQTWRPSKQPETRTRERSRNSQAKEGNGDDF